MKEYQWPYSHISKSEFLAQVVAVEKILRKYGFEYVKDSCEKSTWMLNSDACYNAILQKRIWKRNDNYIRVDRVYFPEKPFLVLEFSEHPEGPYEDADPFPYDLPDEELEQEVRYFLGIETI